jgi:heme/copper-type cytochrome/quinol oxidase subunit 2
MHLSPMILPRGSARRWSLAGLLVAMLCPIASTADDSFVAMKATDETFSFSPDKIVARVGQQETIQLTSTGGVHGVASPELGIDTTLIRPNHPVAVTFTPKEPGQYVVHCANVCGIGHKGMAFVVQVEP